MGQFGFGQSVRRKEDVRFITGRGRYTDDINLPGQAAAFVVRSPHAHATFKIKDVAAAKKAPGVLAVLTGADVKADGLGSIPCKVPLKNRDGSQSAMPPIRSWSRTRPAMSAMPSRWWSPRLSPRRAMPPS